MSLSRTHHSVLSPGNEQLDLRTKQTSGVRDSTDNEGRLRANFRKWRLRLGRHFWRVAFGSLLNRLDFKMQAELNEFVAALISHIATTPETLAEIPVRHWSRAAAEELYCIKTNDPHIRTLFWELDDQLNAGVRNILLIGERGVGKEFFTNYICSWRCAKGKNPKKLAPYSINCSTIVETVAEAILFGTKAGVGISGLTKDSWGIVPIADGHILLLDEFFDAPARLYPMLLRLLHNPREYRLVGARDANLVDPDTIIVAASNRFSTLTAIEEAANRGEVRHDMLDRFDMILEIPPLSSRIDARFIGQMVFDRVQFDMRKEGAKTFNFLSEDTLILLDQIHNMDYSWPGNIRQLEQFIKEQMRLCPVSADSQHLRLDKEDLRLYIKLNKTEVELDNKPLSLWNAKSLRELRHKQLIDFLNAELLKEPGLNPTASWVADKLRVAMSPASEHKEINVSQKLKDALGRTCSEIASELTQIQPEVSFSLASSRRRFRSRES